ncbi:MAG: hypothetical protein ACI8WB_005253 [Phenylobacterium sp.]|jgi:hypothetical protein
MTNSTLIVQNSVEQTLNEIINSLQFITTSLTCLPQCKDEQVKLTAADISGLCNLVNYTKAAAEGCYSQYCKEAKTSSE